MGGFDGGRDVARRKTSGQHKRTAHLLHERPVERLARTLAVVEQHEVGRARFGARHVARLADAKRLDDGDGTCGAQSRDVRLVLVSVQLSHVDSTLREQPRHNLNWLVYEHADARDALRHAQRERGELLCWNRSIRAWKVDHEAHVVGTNVVNGLDVLRAKHPAELHARSARGFGS